MLPKIIATKNNSAGRPTQRKKIPNAFAVPDPSPKSTKRKKKAPDYVKKGQSLGKKNAKALAAVNSAKKTRLQEYKGFTYSGWSDYVSGQGLVSWPVTIPTKVAKQLFKSALPILELEHKVLSELWELNDLINEVNAILKDDEDKMLKLRACRDKHVSNTKRARFQADNLADEALQNMQRCYDNSDALELKRTRYLAQRDNALARIRYQSSSYFSKSRPRKKDFTSLQYTNTYDPSNDRCPQEVLNKQKYHAAIEEWEREKQAFERISTKNSNAQASANDYQRLANNAKTESEKWIEKGNSFADQKNRYLSQANQERNKTIAQINEDYEKHKATVLASFRKTCTEFTGSVQEEADALDALKNKWRKQLADTQMELGKIFKAEGIRQKSASPSAQNQTGEKLFSKRLSPEKQDNNNYRQSQANAVKLFSKALELINEADLYSLRGDCYEALGNYELAYSDFGEIKDSNRQTSLLFQINDEALAQAKKGNHEAAINLCTRGIDLKSIQRFYETRGDVYMKMGDLVNAFKDYKQANASQKLAQVRQQIMKPYVNGYRDWLKKEHEIFVLLSKTWRELKTKNSGLDLNTTHQSMLLASQNAVSSAFDVNNQGKFYLTTPATTHIRAIQQAQDILYTHLLTKHGKAALSQTDSQIQKIVSTNRNIQPKPYLNAQGPNAISRAATSLANFHQTKTLGKASQFLQNISKCLAVLNR